MIDFCEFLSYNPDSGLLVWTGGDPRYIGNVAGSKSTKGYIVIEILGRRYRAHLIAWWFLTGEWLPGAVDHADRDGSNNRALNLRKATRSQQSANQKVSTRNKLGLKGVRLD